MTLACLVRQFCTEVGPAQPKLVWSFCDTSFSFFAGDFFVIFVSCLAGSDVAFSIFLFGELTVILSLGGVFLCTLLSLKDISVKIFL